MMAKFERMQVKGAAELVKLLNQLPARVAKNGLRNAVYAGARVVRDEAKSRAPKAAEVMPNQPPPGTLRRSVIMKHIPELSSLTRQTFFVTVRHGKKYRFQGKKKNLSQDAWYWRFIEFGTIKMAARPFLRPALEVKRQEAVDAITTRLASRIEAEAKKLAKI